MKPTNPPSEHRPMSWTQYVLWSIAAGLVATHAECERFFADAAKGKKGARK